jgi:hypothetical protein
MQMADAADMRTAISAFGLVAAIVAASVGFLFGIAIEHVTSAKTKSKEAAHPSNIERIRNILTINFAFALSLYLIFVSIFAVDIFDPTQADLRAPRSRLQNDLSRSKVVSSSLQQISSSIQKNVADTLPPLDPMLDPAIAASLPSYVQGLKTQLARYVSMLSDLPNNFGSSVEEEANVILQKFDRENRDHFGKHQTDLHADELIQQFQMWTSSWISAASNCRNSIYNEQLLLGQFIIDANQANKKPVDQANFPKWPDPIHISTVASGCNFDSVLKISSSSDLPPRKPDPRWDSIGPMVQWLLNTESRDIALITGLIGFGLFGAVSAPFIRQSAASNGTVFIRGVGAAILIYMVVVGGLAIVTRESVPNPLAVFFACLIAAVYSDDVWRWARDRQRAFFSKRNEKGKEPHS